MGIRTLAASSLAILLLFGAASSQLQRGNGPAPSSAPTTAPSGLHQVWDEAHFFKLPTIHQVDRILDEIHSAFDKDLMIETFPSIPDDFKEKLQQQGKDKFYEGWSFTEGRELGVNGILILITGDPQHLQVAVGNETRLQAFTLTDRDELVEQLAAAFKNKDFDGGIVQGVKFVRDRMAKNLAAATRPSSPVAPPHDQ